jgi:uncharacterized protein YndB with AHSA1/START domain
VTFDFSIALESHPNKVLAALFDPRALRAWFDVEAVVASPRPLGPYAIEWMPTDDRDELLWLLGGIYHGTVIEFRPGSGFFVAYVYWLPPEGDPVGPMALEVGCTPARGAGGGQATILRVTQRGGDDSPRWRRYYEVIGAAWPQAFGRLKDYLEHGQGIWDLRGY